MPTANGGMTIKEIPLYGFFEERMCHKKCVFQKISNEIDGARNIVWIKGRPSSGFSAFHKDRYGPTTILYLLKPIIDKSLKKITQESML